MPHNLHYCWIGLPRTINMNQPAHDLMGPIEMADLSDRIDTQIYFWHLEENTEYYQTLLAGKNIKPCAVESYLLEKAAQSGELGELASRILLLMNTLLDKKQYRKTVRDFVTIKEAFAFFVLAAEGGFVSDTNVLPAANHAGFDSYPNFRMLGFHYPITIGHNDTDADVCFMYSPKNNPAHAIRALRNYLSAVDAIERNAAYNAAILHCVIEAAVQPHAPERELGSFTALRLNRNFPVKIIDGKTRLLKLYYNTHGAGDRGVLSELMKAVVLGNLAAVERLLQDETSDVNEVLHSEDYTNITPLNAAVFYGHTRIAELLIEYGAKQNVALALRPLVNPANYSATLFAIKNTDHAASTTAEKSVRVSPVGTVLSSS